MAEVIYSLAWQHLSGENMNNSGMLRAVFPTYPLPAELSHTASALKTSLLKTGPTASSQRWGEAPAHKRRYPHHDESWASSSVDWRSLPAPLCYHAVKTLRLSLQVVPSFLIKPVQLMMSHMPPSHSSAIWIFLKNPAFSGWWGIPKEDERQGSRLEGDQETLKGFEFWKGD